MYQIRLHYVPERERIYLRDICGADELSVTSTQSTDAIRLLDRLMLDLTGTDEKKTGASLLPVAERDYVLAAVYQRIYGPKIESTIRCRQCDEPFDLDFSLPELVRSQWGEDRDGAAWYQGDGTFKTNDQLHFRLPTGADEYAVLEMPPESAKAALLERCLLAPGKHNGRPPLEEAMEKAGPLIETYLSAECPECGHQQEIFFSIQHYLLSALLQERKQILGEIHQIAIAYRWSHAEIIQLPRTMRKEYAQLIERTYDRM